MGDIIGTISMPLDSDGFLHRECPHCSREFKWLHAESDDQGTMEPDGLPLSLLQRAVRRRMVDGRAARGH